MVRLLGLAALLAVCFNGFALAGDTPSRPGARVYFINLQDGDVVTGPVFIQFGLSGMGVAPAGTEREFTGHHHLLINTTLRPRDHNRALPSNASAGNVRQLLSGLLKSAHVHFGGGQTEVNLDLPPGEYTLQLVFADWTHVPHNPPLQSDVIRVTVE
ncbi:MAG: DUF4399 domain-containing protein [Pseudomonadota bacterium]